MKAIILISSIFYILGLKISNKIDFVKKSNPVDKIITHKIISDKPSKSFFYNSETELQTKPDSIKGGETSNETLLKSK